MLERLLGEVAGGPCSTTAEAPGISPCAVPAAGALIQLRDSLSARGIPLVVVIFPSHHAVTHASQRGQVAWINQLATEERVPAVDLLPSLVASGEPVERTYLLPDDGHPSPRGYAIAAAAVDRWLGLRMPGMCRHAS